MSDANRGPGNEEIPARQPIFLLPPSVTILGGLMVAIHLAGSFIFNEDGLLVLNTWFGFVPYRIIAGNEIEGGFWPLIWTPFTHAFLHAGWDHLIINLLWFAIFATPVARRYGGVSMTIIFLASAAVGAALFAATTLPQVQILIGASGGVAGLTGAASRFIFQPIVFERDPETGLQRPLGRHLSGLVETFTNPRSRGR